MIVALAFLITGCINPSKKAAVDKTFEQTIDEKLGNIANPKNSKVSLSSNPYDYIKDGESIEEYKYIVSQGEKSLDYMLVKFANSNKDGLEEYIMAMTCSEILKENPSSKKWVSGREWYNNYKKTGTTLSADSQGDSPQTVIEKYFQYKNEKSKDKIVTTMTERYNSPNVDWGFDNLDSIKVINIEEEKDDPARRLYLLKGRGRVNGTTENNLKVCKVKYEVKFIKDGMGPVPRNIGVYEQLYFVIRKDENSPWLIDDIGA